MDVVIVGGGKVGRKLVEDFHSEGDNVVLIDTKNELCESVQDTYDVRCVCGSGADVEVLTEAGVNRAELFIAVTQNDELNALCAVMATNLGAQRCAARVRNREYFKQLDFMRNALGINLIVNPEYTSAAEISRILRFPAAINTETFAKGRIELIEFQVGENSEVADKAIHEIYKKFRVKVLVCAVRRGGEVYIPNGDFVLRSGDKIHVTASHRDLARFARETGVMNKKIRSVMLIGGGKISFFLAKLLLESGMSVKIIEQKNSRCRELSENLPGADVVCADGTDRQVLIEEGVERFDALVALTGIDEENMVISMYAKKCGVNKIVTKINRPSIADLLENTGVYSIITPKNLIADEIIRYARAMKSAHDTEMQTLYRIVDNKAEAMEFIVTKNSAVTAQPLSQLALKDNVLVAAILRNNKMFIPDGTSKLEVGDAVIVVTTERITTLLDMLA